ncbi:MAG TPA: hydrogenase formation protein HypD, partial [Chroococcales cyanobacterium]
SLEEENAEKAEVFSVYSPLDALDLAKRFPEKEVIFLGVGFETTTPTVAAAILSARSQRLKNFRVLAANKVIPPPMRALISGGEIRLDGLLCPGHVSAVIGSEAYSFLAEEFGIPCVVAGFEPIEILGAVSFLLSQRKEGVARVDNLYRRFVKKDGNPKARAVVAEVFEPADAEWRGLGFIPGSGLKIRPEFEEFDASLIEVEVPPSREPAGCRCGEVLRGMLEPRECPLFGKACTEERPVGACMVSSEGSCAAAFRYGN